MWLGKNGFKFNKAVLMLSLSDFTFNIKQKIGEGKQENENNWKFSWGSWKQPELHKEACKQRGIVELRHAMYIL